MVLDPRIYYRALKVPDARVGGRLFVAVSSTRISCCPGCTVKPPKRENCRLLPSAAHRAARTRLCAADTLGCQPILNNVRSWWGETERAEWPNGRGARSRSRRFVQVVSTAAPSRQP